MVRDSDIRCPKSHRSSNSTASKVQTQGTPAKDSYPEEFKPKVAKPILFQAAKANKLSEQAYKERKKKKH